MSQIHLGFESSAYPSGRTTEDIAGILESKYHVVETFVDLNIDDMADWLGDAYAKSFEEDKMEDPIISGLRRIEQEFKMALSNGTMEGIISGTPTKAAMDNKSRYFKGGRQVRALPRSFVDSGLYRDAFRAWATYDTDVS